MVQLYTKQKKQSTPTDNPYWMSFSDMMSGILIIFILVCSALIYKLSETEEKIQTNIRGLEENILIRNEMLSEIKNSLDEQGLFVEIDNDTVIVPEKTLDFDSGSFAIHGRNVEAATSLGKKIYEALKKDNRWKLMETIFVEGHTDSVSADKMYRMGNWELSALRAISLWKYWTEDHEDDFGEGLLKMRRTVTENGTTRIKSLFSVSGYADTRRRVTEDNSSESRRQNRRIEIRFIIRSVTPEQLRKIREPLSGLGKYE